MKTLLATLCTITFSLLPCHITAQTLSEFRSPLLSVIEHATENAEEQRCDYVYSSTFIPNDGTLITNAPQVPVRLGSAHDGSSLFDTAEYAKVNGIYYILEPDGTATVTYRDRQIASYEDDVVIPSTITYKDKTYSVTKIGSAAFYNCRFLTSVSLPESITTIEDYAFFCCRNLSEIHLPEHITQIGACAFESCSALSAITLPKNLKQISSSAFSYCSALTSIDLPESVEIIEQNAFGGCGLTSITIPDGVTWISAYLCIDCPQLTTVTIGSSVRQIDYNAFTHCDAIEEIHCRNFTPPICVSDFPQKVYERAMVFVPDYGNALKLYQSAYVWRNFTHIAANNYVAIATPIAATPLTPHYDLSGRKSTQQRGHIYIADGKKYLGH